MMTRERTIPFVLLVVLSAAMILVSAPASARAQAPIRGELQRALAPVMAQPVIKPESGFATRILVPTGTLYDPLFMVPYNGNVLVADDGGADGRGAGGMVVSVDRSGSVRMVADLGQVRRAVGIDVAPRNFGSLAGQLLILTEVPGGNVVQRLDLTKREAAVDLCKLPPAGQGATSKGIAAAAYQARFGPEGSPFADKFFATTSANNTIYQVTGSGKCTPFITFDEKQFTRPVGLGFTPDGKTMLVSGAIPGAPFGSAGVIARVSPEGRLQPGFVVQGNYVRITGFAYAPPGFGPYAGQLFFADRGALPGGLSRGEPMKQTGRIYRLAPDGSVHLVAANLTNPHDVMFVGDTLWICDTNGDYLAGRELPEGYIVELRAGGRP